jgi:hypothetical protein
MKPYRQQNQMDCGPPVWRKNEALGKEPRLLVLFTRFKNDLLPA